MSLALRRQCKLSTGSAPAQEEATQFHPLWFRLKEPGKGHAQGADHWLGQTLVRLPDREGPSLWEYTGEYFLGGASQRGASRDWSRCPDLYGPD